MTKYLLNVGGNDFFYSTKESFEDYFGEEIDSDFVEVTKEEELQTTSKYIVLNDRLFYILNDSDDILELRQQTSEDIDEQVSEWSERKEFDSVEEFLKLRIA